MIALTRRAFGTLALAAGSPTLVEPVLRLPPSNRPTVALTLDACPGAFDARLARSLSDNAIPATIFVTSTWIRSNPTGLAFFLEHRTLFSLQNHGDHHRPAILGTAPIYGLKPAGTLDAIRTEVLDASKIIANEAGIVPKWYRGAAALYSPEVLPAIEQMGFAIGGFSLNADAGASLPAVTTAARIAKAQDRDVIIGHINQPLRPSGAGIAAGVIALKNQGMVFAWLPSVSDNN